MSQAVVAPGMTGEEMVALCRKHSLYEWSAQAAVDPIPVARAKGVYFWTPEDKRYIDFNSQLMCVNAGHGHPKIVKAIQDQAATLAYTNPFMASEARARLSVKLAEITPGDMDVFFFTNGGSECTENAIRLARAVTGRHKILARYRSYHGATAGSLSLTGDPRRWAAEPGISGVVHVLDPYHGMQRGWDTAEQSLRYLEEVIELEGPKHIAAFILETISGTNGILVPPPGYLPGVRALCDKYGIMMICDEVMAGFGRTGKWFGVDHWNVVPDMMTMAKGLTSAYVPLGAVGMRRSIAEHFKDKPFNGGLTYNSHPLGCATALATIAVYEEEGMIDNARKMGEIMTTLHQELAAKHPSVGAARNIGLFGIIELTRNRATMEPMAPMGGSSPEMAALGKAFRQAGLYTFVRWHTFFTNPPLCITEAELREAFAIIDQALDITDRGMTS